jgi:glycosyltransferase involved in cell wall biosynthesis
MDVVRKKILRIATVPQSLKLLTKGQMKFLTEKGFDVYAMSADGFEIQSLYEDELIVKHFKIDLTRKISPLHDIVAIWQCFRVIKSLKPDIVHTYTPKAGLVGMIAAYFAGCKIRLHNVTGLPLMEAKGFKRALLIQIEKTIYWFATQVYVNSFGLIDFINKNIFASNKIKILGNGSTNGIDGSFFKKNNEIEVVADSIKDRLGFVEDTFVWIFIGRIVKDKGINELVEAFKKITESNHNMELIILGSFEDELDPISTQADFEIKNNPKIKVVGFQSDIRPYLCIADCLVFPSYREGLPNVPMQAACFDLPIITTNINGCNEVVSDLENGLLIEPKSSDELADAMEKIYEDTELRKTLKINTRDRILQKYDQKRIWEYIIEEYQKALNDV